MKYHFENKQGWMNDPNGLVFYKGKYHAFFQHYPYAPRWGQMHWGHAVSDDLITWEELDIALFPDREYEDEGGCFSGSAIVKDDRLWLKEEIHETNAVVFVEDPNDHFSVFSFLDPRLDRGWIIAHDLGEEENKRLLIDYPEWPVYYLRLKEDETSGEIRTVLEGGNRS